MNGAQIQDVIETLGCFGLIAVIAICVAVYLVKTDGR